MHTPAPACAAALRVAPNSDWVGFIHGAAGWPAQMFEVFISERLRMAAKGSGPQDAFEQKVRHLVPGCMLRHLIRRRKLACCVMHEGRVVLHLHALECCAALLQVAQLMSKHVSFGGGSGGLGGAAMPSQGSGRFASMLKKTANAMRVGGRQQAVLAGRVRYMVVDIRCVLLRLVCAGALWRSGRAWVRGYVRSRPQ